MTPPFVAIPGGVERLHDESERDVKVWKNVFSGSFKFPIGTIDIEVPESFMPPASGGAVDVDIDGIDDIEPMGGMAPTGEVNNAIDAATNATLTPVALRTITLRLSAPQRRLTKLLIDFRGY